jgi:hypothetical protein
MRKWYNVQIDWCKTKKKTNNLHMEKLLWKESVDSQCNQC